MCRDGCSQAISIDFLPGLHLLCLLISFSKHFNYLSWSAWCALDVPHVVKGSTIFQNPMREKYIGLISGTSGVSHRKRGDGKTILQIRNSTTSPRKGSTWQRDLLWRSPECVRMSLGGRGDLRIGGESDWCQRPGAEDVNQMSALITGRKGRGHWLLKRGGGTCQGHSRLDQSWFPTHRQVWVPARLLRFMLWSKEKRKCDHSSSI